MFGHHVCGYWHRVNAALVEMPRIGPYIGHGNVLLRIGKPYPFESRLVIVKLTETVCSKNILLVEYSMEAIICR